MGPDGPKWAREDFFPTNLDLADILGITDFDFENLYFLDFLGPHLGPGLQPGPSLGPAWAQLGPNLGPGLGPGLLARAYMFSLSDRDMTLSPRAWR